MRGAGGCLPRYEPNVRSVISPWFSGIAPMFHQFAALIWLPRGCDRVSLPRRSCSGARRHRAQQHVRVSVVDVGSGFVVIVMLWPISI